MREFPRDAEKLMPDEESPSPSSLILHPPSLRLEARAKLNLFLRVVGRRADGFHELETVFQSIDLADELTFAPAAELQLTGGCEAAPAGPENLVLRAAAALRAATGGAGGAAMHLEKRVPVGAGLGGGSSDAAATLIALNQLWELDLPLSRLLDIAAALGSDVPFCLLGGTALGRGRGEILEPLLRDARGGMRDENEPSSSLIPHPSSLCFVLVKPPGPVATVHAYARYRPAPPEAPDLPSFLAAWKTGDPARMAPLLRNDLEPGVFDERPELAALREELLGAGALGARMTGSGSVLFGLAWDEAHARQIAERMERPGLWVYRARAAGAGVQVFRRSGIQVFGDPTDRTDPTDRIGALNSRTPAHPPEGTADG